MSKIYIPNNHFVVPLKYCILTKKYALKLHLEDLCLKNLAVNVFIKPPMLMNMQQIFYGSAKFRPIHSDFQQNLFCGLCRVPQSIESQTTNYA